jgi:hypothetical protein
VAGRFPWSNTAALTVAASPLLSPWLQVQDDMFQVLPGFLFTGGTSVHSLEGSFDGSTLDTTLPAYAAPTLDTLLPIRHPYIRWRTVQTVGTATVATVYLRAKP